MGQQQLLLLVLGIVIVGLAVVVGIQAFSENQKKANADALVLTSMRIASDAQTWLRKPAAFGGGVPSNGDRPDNFADGITIDPTTFFDQLGYPTPVDDDYRDANGLYTLAVVGTGILQITATSASTSGASEDNNTVCVLVGGSSTDQIATFINPASGCPTSLTGS